jgi:hypothetical protein
MTGNRLRHGEARNGGRSREWRAWNAMIRRCTYPSMDRYARYGGRGISICPAWRESFEQFLADMGRAPSESHQLDRIDNDGNYEPGNCRWASREQQIRNSSRARLITAFGRTMHIGDWSAEIGVNRQTIQMRIDKYGWTPERAVSRKS